MMTGGVRKRPGTWLYKTSVSENKTRLIEWNTGLGGNNAALLLVFIALGEAAARIDIYRDDELVSQIPVSGVGNADLGEIQYAVTHEAGASTLWLVHRKIPPQSMTVTEGAVPKTLDTPVFFETYDPGPKELGAGEYSFEPGYTWNEETGLLESATGTFSFNPFLARPGIGEINIVNCSMSLMLMFNEPFYFPVARAKETFPVNDSIFLGQEFTVDLNPAPEISKSSTYKMDAAMSVGPVPPAKKAVFNEPGKYPGTAAVYAGRLCLGGTDEYPSRIWLSRPPDSITGLNRYTDFTPGDNPADAIVIEENDMEGSRIKWLAAGRRLAAGTARATWSDNGAVPTPASFDMSIVEYIGATALQPKGTKEIIVYAGRNNKTLRALVWQESAEGAGFIDLDISRNAPHLFASGIRDFDVADYPYPVIWIITEEGALVSCTVDVRSGILAMSRHDTVGKFESCTVRRRDGQDDTLFLITERPEGGKRDIVTLTLTELVNADYAESHYTDCGIRVEFDPPATEAPLPEPLRRDGIQVFADGAQETAELSGDKSTVLFRNPVRLAHIGLPYKSELSPNTPEIPANGTSIGKKRRIEKALLKVFGSLGGRCGTTEDKAAPIPYTRYGQYTLGGAPRPFTGDIDMTVGGTIDPEGRLVITHGEPLPFTLLALVERVAILEV
jgi:hypothetical protein